MNTPLIKICGITSLTTARSIAVYKPDILGLIFVPNRKRTVSLSVAKEISRVAKDEGIEISGVFQDQSLEEILSIVQEVGLDFVQLHGEESPEFCGEIRNAKVIKTIREDKADREIMDSYLPFVDYFLLDRSQQGEGELFDLQLAKELCEEYPVFFGGGLTPENVREVVKEIGPKLRGVDVNSGVENETGNKDLKYVECFIQQARLFSNPLEGEGGVFQNDLISKHEQTADRFTLYCWR